MPYWSNDEGQVNGVRHHLWIFNLATQLLTDLVPPTFDVANFWYQGGRLLISGVSYQNSRAFKDGLYEYDFSHHDLVDLISPGQYRFDDIAILNQRLFAVASNGQRFGMGENPNFYRYHYHHLELVAPWDSNLGNIVVNDMTVVSGNASLVQDDKLYFYTTVVDHNEFYQFDGHQTTRLFSWSGAVNSFVIKNDQFIFTATTAEQPEQLPN